MDSLPLPQLRSSWVAALINTMLLFLVYYLVAFGGLLNLYKHQFDPVYFAQSENQLKVWAYVPHYYNASEPAWVYTYIQNESDNPVYDIEVYLIATFDESTLLLPKLYDKEVYSSGTKFDIISPHSVTTARVPFVAQAEPIITKVVLIKIRDGTREELERLNPKEFIRVNQSGWRSLQHSFLESILLPPWSNGFILALALFSSYLARKGEEKYEPEPFKKEWWDLVANTVWQSIKILLVMIMLTFLFLYINEVTISPVLCMFALGVLLVLDTGGLEKYLSESLREWLISFAFSLGILGVVPASLSLLFNGLNFLIPGSELLQFLLDEKWTWVMGGLGLLIWFAVRKRAGKLEAYTTQIDSWGYAFSILSILSVVALFLSGKGTNEKYIPWIILTVLGLGTPLWHQLLNRLRKNSDSENIANSITPNSSSSSASAYKEDKTKKANTSSLPVMKKGRRKK